MKRFRTHGARLPFYQPVHAVEPPRHDAESENSSRLMETTSPGPWSRMGSSTGAIIVLGTILQIAAFAFLVFLWTGRGPDPNGAKASPLWRKIILSGFSTKTVTICTLIIRSAVGLQATVCTGLAAALVLEARDVSMVNAATFSILRAVNSGPTSFILPLARTPRKLATSVPALLIIVLWLGSLVISFSSTILLSDFTIMPIIPYSHSIFVALPEFVPELIDPFMSTSNLSGSDPGVWHQALQVYPTFAETTLETPSVLDSLSDTGLIKRSIIPLGAQSRKYLHSYQGASPVYTSRVGCTRPTISGVLSGIKTGPAVVPLMEGARISGTLTWKSQNGHPFLDGLSCESTGASCPPVPFDCALPYIDYPGHVLGKSILPHLPTSLCIIRDENYAPGGPRPGFLLVWETNIDAAHWGSITNNRSQFPLSQQINSYEWAVSNFGGNFTLNATVCLFNSTMGLERVSLSTTGRPTSSGSKDMDSTISYYASMGGWFLDGIIKKVTISFPYGATPSYATVNTSYYSRGIMALNSWTTITTDELNKMYANSPNFDLSQASGADISSKFFDKVQDSVTFMFAGTDTPPQAGNFSIYMCATCTKLGGYSLQPHPYLDIVFHEIAKTASVAQALHATLFWLHQAQYYNILPLLHTSDNATSVSTLNTFAAPSSHIGIIVVGCFMLLNLICVFTVTGSFLRRTRWSLYGNKWHVVAQLVAGAEMRLTLESATVATDQEVKGKLQKDGIKDINVGLWDQGGGRIAMASGTGWVMDDSTGV